MKHDEPEKALGGAAARQRSIFQAGLGRRLLLWFLALAIIPLATVSVMSYLNARKSLYEDAEKSLAAIAGIKTQYIRSHFARTLTDLAAQSEMVANAEFLEELQAAFIESGKPLADFVKSFRWELIVHERSPDLKAFHKTYGHHDVFLIDAEGNILFTVVREDDLGTNILEGPYSDTLFAAACRKALQTGRPTFSDYERYAPSGDAVAGFLASVLLNEDGDKIGLVALQVAINQIDGIMQGRAGLGQTGESYLVGADLRMRSNSALEEGETVLREEVKTEQTQLWRQEHVEGEESPEMAETTRLYQGRRGRPVLGNHHDLEIAGVPWALLVEVETAEAFGPVRSLLVVALAIGAAALVVVAVVAVTLSRRIARPITDAVNRLGSTGAELLAASRQQSATSKEQAAAVNEIGSTMEEVTQSGGQVSERARQVGTTAEATSSAGAAGLEAVREANRSMQAIREQVEEVAENIVALSERTQAVGEIISTVNDIAEQSNLLALNAAIEAAATGLQGARFSVVANEMKNLANQARESTVQVRTILEEIRKGINTSVMTTEEAVKRAESGKQQTDTSEGTIQELIQATQDSVQAFQQISGATSQQQIGIDEIMRGMEDIRTGAAHTASSAGQIEGAAADLNALSARLRELVE